MNTTNIHIGIWRNTTHPWRAVDGVPCATTTDTPSVNWFFINDINAKYPDFLPDFLFIPQENIPTKTKKD